MYREVAGVIVLLGFAMGMIFYNSLPERVAVHWSEGRADRFAEKFEGVFFLPFAAAAAYVGLSGLSRDKTHDKYVSVFVGFLVALAASVIAFNLGYDHNMTGVVAVTLSVALFLAGEGAKMRGKKSRVFGVAAIIMALSVFAPEYFVFVVALLAVLLFQVSLRAKA